MNNISFQGKTSLIFDNAIYDRVIMNKGNNHITNLNLRPEANCRIFNGKYSVIDLNYTPNVSVLLLKEKGGIFFHKASEKIIDILEAITKMKKNTEEKLTAWIIGGQNNAKTVRDVNALAEVLCDRSDIDTSIIAGNKDIVPNITIHPLYNNLEMGFSMPIKTTKLSKDLEDYFDIVELNNTSVGS